MRLEVDREFEAVAAEALRMADLTPPDKFIQVESARSHVVAHTPEDRLYVSIERTGPGTRRPENTLMASRADERFKWRGRLTDAEGTFVVMPDVEATVQRRCRSTRVRMRAMSTEDAINDLQTDLGRTPGKDALKLVRVDTGRGHHRAGVYVERAAELELPVAAPRFWRNASHDLRANDHVLTWVGGLSDSACLRLAQQAKDIKNYGRRIHDVDDDHDNRPAEVADFANGLDLLSFSARKVFNALHLVEDPRGNGFRERFGDTKATSSPAVSLRTVMNELTQPSGSGKRPEFEKYMRWIGVVTREHPVEEVARDMVAHMAGMLINLEKIAAREQDSSSRRGARRETWQAIVDRYGAVA